MMDEKELFYETDAGAIGIPAYFRQGEGGHFLHVSEL